MPLANLAVIGRYILTPNVMHNLSTVQKGAGGEIQLTDAIAQEISEDRPVYGYRFRGQRFDCGSKAGFVAATVHIGTKMDLLCYPSLKGNSSSPQSAPMQEQSLNGLSFPSLLKTMNQQTPPRRRPPTRKPKNYSESEHC